MLKQITYLLIIVSNVSDKNIVAFISTLYINKCNAIPAKYFEYVIYSWDLVVMEQHQFHILNCIHFQKKSNC